MTDSAGVLIIESELGATGELALASEPLLELGPAPDDSSEPLYRVVGLARVGEHIIVGNGGTNQVFFYDSAGNRVRSIGRKGGAPGEFERLSEIFVLPGDSVLTYDTGLRRFQVFDREGQFVRSFSLRDPEQGEGHVGALPLDVGEGRTLVIRTLSMPEEWGSGSQTSRATMHVLTYSLTGEFQDSLLSTPGWEAFNSSSGRLRNVPIPFAHSSSLAALPSSIVLGLSEANEVRFYALNGQLLRIIRDVAPPGPLVQADEITTFIARAVGNAPAGMSADLKAVYEEMPIPDRKPPFNWVYGWGDGSVWVSTSQGDESWRRMLIVDKSDGRSAWLSIPRAFAPLEVIQGRVWGTWTDELGIETLREYRIDGVAPRG